ncbi:MAG TPA: hypothetical protein VLK58_13545 [Conexibacter sp.]|nr:hypothetical protein [Conexibacter sp.]
MSLLAGRAPAAPVPLLVALAALLVLTLADSWRVALLVALTGAAIGATRIRYAAVAAASLAVVVAALTLAAGPIGDNDRPARERIAAPGERVR